MSRPRPLILAVVCAQVLVPASMLIGRWAQEGIRATSERPASWQMYSFVAPATYTGAFRNGTTHPLPVDGLPLLVRAVDTGRDVPDRLCQRTAGLLAVTRRGGPDPGVFTC